MAIELIDGRRDITTVARIATEVLRWVSLDVADIEHAHAVEPTWRDWIALAEGTPVGVGACALRPGTDGGAAAPASVLVLLPARHRGVGRALLRRVSDHARELGRSELELFAFADDPDAEGFAAKHGFRLVARNRGLRLQLAGCPRPSVHPPADVAITTLAERPELARGVWETASETIPDIPWDGDEPLHAGTFDEFSARQLSGPRYIAEATFVAVAGEHVVGYGQLGWANRSAGVAMHDLLAVRRAARGRGIAKALKAAQITWAIDNGLSELLTSNEERNRAARAVNAHFPYTPAPDGLMFCGAAA